MCARYKISRAALNRMLAEYGFELVPFSETRITFRPDYILAPYDPVPAIRLMDGKKQFAQLQWAFMPKWMGRKYSTWNAKAETVKTSPLYRSAYKHRRCLLPAETYVEFEKQGKLRLPWRYEIDGGKLFAMAGLWQSWQHPETKETLDTCTLIVTTPNDLTAQIHDRMPVIVDEPDYDAWLAGEEIPLVPFPADRMTAIPNSIKVNNSRYKESDAIGPREGTSPG